MLAGKFLHGNDLRECTGRSAPCAKITFVHLNDKLFDSFTLLRYFGIRVLQSVRVPWILLSLPFGNFFGRWRISVYALSCKVLCRQDRLDSLQILQSRS